MKMNDVPVAVLKQSLQRVAQIPEVNDKTHLTKALQATAKDTPKILNKDFGNAYKSRKFHYTDVIVVALSLVVGFVIPLPSIYKVGIALGINLVYHFILNNGLKYLYKDNINKLVYSGEYKINYKPKLGVFEPIVIGRDDDWMVQVYKLEEGLDVSKVKRGRLYIADKETLGYMLNKYLENAPESLETSSNKIDNRLVQEYMRRSRKLDFEEDLIRHANSFNKE